MQERLYNAKASTVHGLAKETKARYTAAGKFATRIHFKTIKDKLGCTMPIAWWVSNTLKVFCESADPQIKSEHVPYCGGNPSTKTLIIESATKIWKAMVNLNDPFPISFDGYLKLFQLSNPKLRYDTILIDESQDSNPVTLAIVRNQPHCSIILIGDESQKIYSWRSAVNAFQEWTPTTTFELTESFRFGKNIATLASVLLSNFQNRQTPLIGHKPIDSIGVINKECPHTYIARTNSSLYEKAIEYSEQGKLIHFVGTTEADNWDPSVHYKFNDASDVYHLYTNQKNKIRNQYFRNFENYKEFKAIATGEVEGESQTGDKIIGDAELAALARITEKYKDKLPTVLAQIVGACTSEGNADITLVTAHRAKGLEWDIVKMADDFSDLVIEDKSDKEGKKKARRAIPDLDAPADEFNLIYVAATRAKRHLELGLQLSKFCQFKDLHINTQAWNIKEVPFNTVIKKTKVPIAQASNRTFLKVPFNEKEEAKAKARLAGGILKWHAESKKWEWVGKNSLPKSLEEYKT